jgi:type I restriction enzyme S subunit
MSEIIKNTSVVPNGWTIVPLGDVLQYEQPYYYTVTSDDYNDIAGTPVLTAGKSFLLGYTTEVDNVYNNLPVIIFDDFTTDSKFVDFPFKVKSSAMKFLRPKEENVIDLRLIFEFIQKLKISVANADHKRRWISEFSKIKILIPPYPEQRQIARILSTADAVIEKTQAAIAKYKAIKQGMLHDLFTRGIDLNTGKLRPRYQDAPHLYKESKLGMIPREWDEIPLEELTTQIGDGIHTTPKYSQNTHFYFINGNNLVNGEIQIGSALCVSEEEFEKHFKKLDERTIMYSINGTIGNIAFYKNEQVIIGKSVCYISCKPSVNLDYIYFLLQTFQVSKFYELQLTASTIRNLSLATVRGTPITIPKDEREQNLIAERIKAINTKLQTEQTYLQKMQSLKKGLMEDLLSGKKSLNL